MASSIKVKLDCYDYYKNIIQYSNMIELNLNNKVLFEFNESDKIKATFYFDECIKIKYEDHTDDNLIDIKNNETFELSSGMEESGAYFAGYFSIYINNQEYFFFVKPKQLEYEYVLNIRNYVNSFYNGLSLEMIKSRKRRVQSNYDSSIKHNKDYLFMEEKLPKLFNYFNQYLVSQYVELEKRNTISSKGKSGPKTAKWLLTKGISKNDDIYNPDKYLIRKSTPVLDNELNRAFKKELMFWYGEIGRICASIEHYLKKEEKVKEEQIKEIEELKNTIKAQEETKQIAKNVKIRDNMKLESLEQSLSDRQSYNDNYLEWLKQFKHYKTNLEHILFNSWVKNVSNVSNSSMNVSNKCLKLIYNIKNEYLGAKQYSNNGLKQNGFAEKSTPKLFETFTYVMILDILFKNDFELVNYDVEKDDLIPILSNSSVITLSNNEFLCDVIYDKVLKESDDTHTKSEFVNINSRHNKPDFIVAFKDKEDNIFSACVIDSKWRKASSIYNENGDTDVSQQLKDYYQLGYYKKGERKPLKRSIIDKAIAIYPSSDEEVIDISGDDGVLAIGIIPFEDIENTNGFINIENVLRELIDEAFHSIALS